MHMLGRVGDSINAAVVVHLRSLGHVVPMPNYRPRTTRLDRLHCAGARTLCFPKS